MKVDLGKVQELIGEALKEPPTGDAWLDAKYLEDIPIIGHTNPYYKLFYLIAREFEPGLTVELGTYRGTAASHFAAGSPNGIVCAVDWHRDEVDKVHQRSAIAASDHYGNLDYINKCSWDEDAVQLISLVAHNKELKDYSGIDILFIDAWHWYEHAIREWNLYNPLLADEALVICDDIFDAEGATIDMTRFWKEVSEPYENFITTDIHIPGIPMGFVRFIR